MPSPIQAILLDIEGTTTDIAFVHQTLFPYARAHLEAFLTANQQPAVNACLQAVCQTVLDEEGRKILPENKWPEALPEILNVLHHWIDTDRKHPALKQLQGMLWQAGYQQGEYKGHVYADVRPAFSRWKASGLWLGIYSSGSVQAQQLLFKHSLAGDLTPFLEGYYDTAVGPKQAVSSYQTILQAIAKSLNNTHTIKPEAILFLSDVPAELEAAQAAGLQVSQVLRPGTVANTLGMPTITSFDELKI